MSAQGVVNGAVDAKLDAVLAIWRDVLDPAGMGSIDPDSNFFLCGGDSLDLMRVIARVRECFGIALDLREVGSFSTARRMAQRCVLADAPTRCASGQRGVTVESPIAGRLQAGNGDGTVGPPRHGRLPARFPATAGQRALWLADQLGGGGLYNTAVLVHFTGDLQVPVLARALSALLHRHEVLRSSLRYEMRSRALVAHVSAPCDVGLDVAPVHPHDVRQVFVDAAAQPFEFGRGPLWRVCLAQTDERQWTLLFVLHHAVTDGWSGSVLLRNFADAYRALLRDRAWWPEGIDVEFRRWSMQQPARNEEGLLWWRAYLAGADDLPSWPPATGTRWPYTMACEARALPTDACVDVQRAARTLHLRPAALFLTTLRLALAELTGIRELCIGMPVNLRDGSAQDVAVGYFVNLLVLRDQVEGPVERGEHGRQGRPERGVDAVRRIQLALDAALCHRSMPFGELARQLNPAHLPSGNIWCDILFAFQNLPRAQPDFGDVSAHVEALTMPRGQHPLKVEVLCSAEGYAWRIEYARECLAPAEVRALLDAMERQLATLLAGAARSS